MPSAPGQSAVCSQVFRIAARRAMPIVYVTAVGIAIVAWGVEPVRVGPPRQDISLELVAAEDPVGRHTHHRDRDEGDRPGDRSLRCPDIHDRMRGGQDAEDLENQQDCDDHGLLPLPQCFDALTVRSHTDAFSRISSCISCEFLLRT